MSYVTLDFPLLRAKCICAYTEFLYHYSCNNCTFNVSINLILPIKRTDAISFFASATLNSFVSLYSWLHSRRHPPQKKKTNKQKTCFVSVKYRYIIEHVTDQIYMQYWNRFEQSRRYFPHGQQVDDSLQFHIS